MHRIERLNRMDRPQSYAPDTPAMSQFQKLFLAALLVLSLSILHTTRYVSTGDYRATVITDTWRGRDKVCYTGAECTDWHKK